MRSRKRQLPFIALLAVAAAMAVPAASSGANPTVEALSGGLYETVRWSPPEEAIATGGSVTFLNSSPTVSHGIVWTSAVQPACGNTVPVGLHNSAPNWNGSCTFAQAGEYTYYCSYHGPPMHGVIYVNANGTFPPSVTTGTATGLTQTEAALRGTVNPRGQPTSYYFNYGTSSAYGLKTTEAFVGEDSAGHSESATVSPLQAGTVYHFQIVAIYASGASIVRGADQTFSTVSPPGAPTASTGEASPPSETGATVNGTVNPHGEVTTYFFNYGTTDSYGETTAVQPVGEDSTNHIVSATLTGLSPGTVYHFEIVAHNASGNAPGLDRTFTTLSPVLPVPETTTTPTVTPPPVLSGGSTPPPPGPGASTAAVSGSPLAGSASTAVKVATTQHGSSVRGSLAVSPAGAGGRLEVDLLSASAALARAKSAPVLVGRSLRSVAAGKVSFSVPLSARARSALSRHRHLSIVVKITLTPPHGHGAAVTVTRSVLLRR